MSEEIKEFPKEIHNMLNYYVYRLIDPRNGETFYVGKGKDNRVFAHAGGNLEIDEFDEKMARIREIQNSGFDVAHVIHRHGMDENTAFEVEAALIDAYTGLTNIMNGHGNNDYGVMHVNEVFKRYQAEIADLSEGKVLLISVNRSIAERTLYDAVRYAWRLDKRKAEQADVILAIKHGIVVGAFVAEKWMKANVKNFPGMVSVPGRFGFKGKEADTHVKAKYVGKLIPERFRKKGASNPIRYSW